MQHYLVEIFWSHEDEGYIATVPDLPGCCARAPRNLRARAKNRNLSSLRRIPEIAHIHKRH